MSWFQMILEKLKTAKCFNSLQALREERGAIFVLTAILLPLLLGCLGFAYDAGNLYIHKARLQNTADAAALAGGRAYVNALSEYATNGVVSSAIDETIKTEAKGTMKSSAQQYIRVNNPLFAGKSGKDEKFWFGIKSISGTNSTEYFRVNLTEPVQLYFLPVIGIQKSVDVKAYATTKLTDTVVTSGGNNQQVDAENRPIVIAGSTFYDESNTDDPTQHVYNYYNASTVYVATGGTSNVVTVDGKKVVPSSGGTITGKIYPNGHTEEEAVNITYAEVVETDYDMMAFGEEIKKLFIEKYISTLHDGQQTAKREKLTEFMNDLKAWDKDKSTWDKKYKAEYDRRYNLYKEALGFEKAQSIYALIQQYRTIIDDALITNGPAYNYDRTNAYNALVKDQWESAIKALTGLETDFSDCIAGYNIPPKPTSVTDWTNWQWQQYTRFGITQPPSLSEYVTDEIMAEYMAQFGSLGSEPKPLDYGLEYYMTYQGYNGQTRMDPFKTSVISAKEELSGSEHSFFYLSSVKGGYSNSPQTNIEIDGFYVKPEDGITNDTPFYLFIENDVDLVNFIVKNTNRPLIICYFGTSNVHYEFESGTENNLTTYRGFFYTPSASAETHMNGDYLDYKGAFIAENMTIHGKFSNYEYDVNEVSKWQDEGLPVTPNVGFTSSSGGGNSGESTNTITLTDRLRLFLAGNTNQNYYYNPDDGNWDWTPL